MVRRSVLLLLLTLSFVSSGCIHIRETIQIASDGSGTVCLRVSFPQLGNRFLTGTPAASWIEPNLPEGVRLTSLDKGKGKTRLVGQDGKEHELDTDVYDAAFSFGRLDALNRLRIRPDRRNVMAASAGRAPGETDSPRRPAGSDVGPFQQMTLKRDGSLLRFRRVIQAAREPDEIESAQMSTPGSGFKPQVVDLGAASLVVSIECPGKVVEHNADQISGRTLTWSFSLKQLQQSQDRDWVIYFSCNRAASGLDRAP